MIQLQITKINKWQYVLKNVETNKEYVHTFEFHGLKKKLKAGDRIIMHKELLDPKYVGYSVDYTFGPVDDIYGRKVTSVNDIDAIGIKQGDVVTTLKRFYG